MIRVNLLAADPSRVSTPRFAGLGTSTVHIVGSLIVVAALAGVAYRHLDLQTQQREADVQLQQARAEAQRLEAVSEELARFEAQTALLQQRVALIEQLRKGQRSPVTLLDHISRGLPDRLWLTQLTQAGADVTIEGRTTTLTALSDLIGNLESSGAFARPVEILNSQVESGEGGDLVTFVVKAIFPMGAIDAPADPTAAARMAAAAAARP